MVVVQTRVCRGSVLSFALRWVLTSARWFGRDIQSGSGRHRTVRLLAGGIYSDVWVA